MPLKVCGTESCTFLQMGLISYWKGGMACMSYLKWKSFRYMKSHLKLALGRLTLTMHTPMCSVANLPKNNILK